ncbi:hypothetical protein L596_012299 [Steinernema carpocapsae]|uniref:Uncharacterized protein n=1 Tax=Steinernema carpocapsae TaxID=34508 RepID=A0A4V6A4S8_STECR|nr:hypothetical protein L596_012299 [Steinernema carpocapsae]
MDEGEANKEITPVAFAQGAAKTVDAGGKQEELTGANTDYETIADELALRAVKLRFADEDNYKKSSKKLVCLNYLLPVATLPIVLGCFLICLAQVLRVTNQNAATAEFEECLKKEEWSAWTPCDAGAQQRKKCKMIMKRDCACPGNDVCGKHLKVLKMNSSMWTVEANDSALTFNGESGFYDITDISAPGKPC